MNCIEQKNKKLRHNGLVCFSFFVNGTGCIFRILSLTQFHIRPKLFFRTFGQSVSLLAKELVGVGWFFFFFGWGEVGTRNPLRCHWTELLMAHSTAAAVITR